MVILVSDVGTIVLIYIRFYVWRMALVLIIQAIKLRLEFVVLNRLAEANTAARNQGWASQHPVSDSQVLTIQERLVGGPSLVSYSGDDEGFECPKSGNCVYSHSGTKTRARSSRAKRSLFENHDARHLKNSPSLPYLPEHVFLW